MRQVIFYPGEIGRRMSKSSRMCQPRKTKEDAIQNIREAIEGYILALKEDGLTVPPDHFDAVLVAV